MCKNDFKIHTYPRQNSIFPLTFFLSPVFAYIRLFRKFQLLDKDMTCPHDMSFLDMEWQSWQYFSKNNDHTTDNSRYLLSLNLYLGQQTLLENLERIQTHS